MGLGGTLSTLPLSGKPLCGLRCSGGPTCHRLSAQRIPLSLRSSFADARDGRLSTSEPSSSSSTTTTSPADPYVAGGRRLQSLLAGVGNGEDELASMMISQEAPERKLQINVVVGAVVTVAAIIISSMCGRDPWGGASLSLGSLGAAAIGVAASAPLVAARLWSWTPQASRMLPALEDMHHTQLELSRPWLSQMTAAHALAFSALETLPIMLLMLPAAQGGLTTSMVMYNTVLHRGFGVTVPETTAAVLALVLTALVSGFTKSIELDVEEDQYETVENAMKNSDRYYRLMAMDTTRGLPDAQRAARAFDAVAQAWIDTRGDACILAGCLAALEVAFYGGLWYLTSDLTAPAVAAVCVNWAEVRQLHDKVVTREAALAQRSSGSGGRSGRREGGMDE